MQFWDKGEADVLHYVQTPVNTVPILASLHFNKSRLSIELVRCGCKHIRSLVTHTESFQFIFNVFKSSSCVVKCL